jgi:hypothetical protein
MHKITLVFSVHKSNGNCNVEELAKILRRIEPDVVFQEVGPSHSLSLEAQAVAEYCKYKLCQSVHVDDYEAPVNGEGTMQLLNDGRRDVADRSTEYQKLEIENLERTCRDGFGYMNSFDIAKAMVQMEQIEDELMAGRAAEALQWFRQVMRNRELEMMRNIYSYCQKNPFDIGIFLVGAAHRTGIAMQIEKFCGRVPDLIAWDFYGGQIPKP